MTTKTTAEYFILMLTGNGMSEDQAREVLEFAKPEIAKMDESYEITWNRPANEYPAPVLSVLWVTLKHIALKWIEQNKPQAWFKPMFA